MELTNNAQVLDLLNGAGKPAPEMTRGLSVLGDGNMADGLVALWEDGQKNGIVRGVAGAALVFTAGIGLYALIKNVIAARKAKQVIKAACSEMDNSDQTEEVQVPDELCEVTLVNNGEGEIE